MEHSAVDQACVGTMKLFGDFWTLRILNALGADGELRFNEIQRAIDNCNPVTLTDRLKKLEEARLVSRTVDPNGKKCVTYRLADRGYEALPVIDALNTFAAKTKL